MKQDVVLAEMAEEVKALKESLSALEVQMAGELAPIQIEVKRLNSEMSALYTEERTIGETIAREFSDEYRAYHNGSSHLLRQSIIDKVNKSLGFEAHKRDIQRQFWDVFIDRNSTAREDVRGRQRLVRDALEAVQTEEYVRVDDAIKETKRNIDNKERKIGELQVVSEFRSYAKRMALYEREKIQREETYRQSEAIAKLAREMKGGE